MKLDFSATFSVSDGHGTRVRVNEMDVIICKACSILYVTRIRSPLASVRAGRVNEVKWTVPDDQPTARQISRPA